VLSTLNLQPVTHWLLSIVYWLSPAHLPFAICHLPFPALAGGIVLAAAPIAVTEDQLREFTSLLDEVKGGWSRVKELPDLLKRVEDENAGLKLELGKLKKSQITGV